MSWRVFAARPLSVANMAMRGDGIAFACCRVRSRFNSWGGHYDKSPPLYIVTRQKNLAKFVQFDEYKSFDKRLKKCYYVTAQNLYFV